MPTDRETDLEEAKRLLGEALKLMSKSIEEAISAGERTGIVEGSWANDARPKIVEARSLLEKVGNGKAFSMERNIDLHECQAENRQLRDANDRQAETIRKIRHIVTEPPAEEPLPWVYPTVGIPYQQGTPADSPPSTFYGKMGMTPAEEPVRLDTSINKGWRGEGTENDDPANPCPDCKHENATKAYRDCPDCGKNMEEGE